MKATTLASIIALSAAGVACSEKAPIPPEQVETATTETAAAGSQADTAPQFNLRYPGSEPATSQTSNGGFNLRTPDTLSSSGGPRLPDAAVRENAFDDIPEIRTPAVQAPRQDIPVPEDEDAIIRLD